jgi:hypothetical protein
MSAPMPATSLDSLAAGLRDAVREAAVARQGFALATELAVLRRDLENVTAPIHACTSVLEDAPQLELAAEQREGLADRRAWVAAQLEKVRAALADDPGSLRRGELWRETRRATGTLAKELEAARAEAYAAFLAGFAAGDAELLAALPATTDAVRDYRAAIAAFEEHRRRPPESPADVTAAAAAGRRLAALREQVEQEAVPPAFQPQWRALRGGGLPLDELTPDFRAWLDEHDHTRSVVLTYLTS